jgi:hypothetical protein
MSVPQLLAWLLSLPALLDGAGHPIARPREAASVIATVAASEPEALFIAAALDTFAALESGYHPRAAGDCPGMRAGSPLCTRALGAKSCGAWQTPCSSTSEDPATQARQWVAILKRSMAGCPVHPLALLGTGRCMPWGARREGIIRAALAVPVPPEDGT